INLIMDFRSIRIVFLGTPEFAKASLEALVDAGCNIVGVITAPDKPAGRGMKLTQSAVKEYAVSQGLHVLQPEKLKNPAFLEELRALKADLQLVVAFRMLPELVWNMPPMGTINLHGSLLPDYRGAAPINWAIINGEKQTGVTTFKLVHEIDKGNILLQEIMPIGDNETAGELHDRMKLVGAGLLVDTVKKLAEGGLHETPQSSINTEPKHAPKIFTDTCRIDWTKDAESIYNLIRGLSPYPAAFTTLQDKNFKIFESEKEIRSHNDTPGSFSIEGGKLRFACTNGYIYPKTVQAEGKKKMACDDFVRGARF
ncbi:MAG TPA: methionyl-tRNA formyltransferase, partial [Chitinophagaceae bacterium]|nr:methionyl-tRNA formyltransferase [Chitinophagaceae bacterium]